MRLLPHDGKNNTWSQHINDTTKRVIIIAMLFTSAVRRQHQQWLYRSTRPRNSLQRARMRRGDENEYGIFVKRRWREPFEQNQNAKSRTLSSPFYFQRRKTRTQKNIKIIHTERCLHVHTRPRTVRDFFSPARVPVCSVDNDGWGGHGRCRLPYPW